MRTPTRLDTGGLAAAVASILVGLYVFLESGSFSRLGAVFPRVVAVVLVLTAMLLIARILLGRQRAPEPAPGSNGRRAALAAVMVLWVAAIPAIGFLEASLAGFAAATLTAKYGRWSARRWAAYGGVALVTVGLVYTLFAWVLKVPFPAGRLLG